MSYGILIENQDGRVQIDSNTGYPTLYQSTNSTINSDSNVTFSSISNSSSSLVFARPVATTGSYPLFRDTSNYVKSNAGSQIEYRVFRQTTEGLVVPTTGYGLNVYNSSGSPVYSATSSSYTASMEILATGTFGFGASDSVDIPLSQNYPLSSGRVYVLLNTAFYYVPTSNENFSAFYYEYLFDEGAYGTIRLYAATITVEVIVDPITFVTTVNIYSAPASNGNSYIIGYLRG